jgi:hypothetical protein
MWAFQESSAIPLFSFVALAGCTYSMLDGLTVSAIQFQKAGRQEEAAMGKRGNRDNRGREQKKPKKAKEAPAPPGREHSKWTPAKPASPASPGGAA